MNLAVEIELNLRILFKIANYVSLNSKQENEN